MTNDTELLDEFGSLACKIIWETLGNIDFDWTPNPEHLLSTENEIKQENLNKSKGLSKSGLPIIKLRYKRLYMAQQSIKKEIKHFPIVLTDEQTSHQERLSGILKDNPFAFDFSMMGTGKTYVSSTIFQKDGYEHLVCIVPCSVKTKWQYMHQNHGVDLDALISYSELRSKKFNQPKHGLLIRRDKTKTIRNRDGTTRQVEVCNFEATENYLNRVKNGVILVIDEMQNIKNTNDQLTACQELIRPILEKYKEECKILKDDGVLPPNFKRSRVLLLSGSPMDKKSQVIHFFRCLGIMRSDKLRTYNPFLGIKQDQGIQEIRSFFMKRFPKQYDSYCLNHNYGIYSYYDQDETIAELEDRSYSMFQKILKPELSSSMNPLTNIYKLNQYSGFFQMERRDLDLLYNGIENLERATNYNSLSRTVDFGHNGIDALRNIQRALVMIETSKINLLIRLTKERLSRDPNQKVVIAVNYTETIIDLMDGLKEFNPLRMTGEANNKKRFDILEKFQHNSSEYRLIIGNMAVLSTGIDLDDNNGKFPRVAFVNPNYSAIGLYQFGYRFHRVNTKSDSEVYFVFGRDVDINENDQKTELPILDSLSKKGEILAETCDNQRLAGIKFPGNYPKYWETPMQTQTQTLENNVY